jgi:hypothetical protein
VRLQAEAGVGAPVGLDPRLSGLVESWAEGYADWGQLCASTRSLGGKNEMIRLFEKK